MVSRPVDNTAASSTAVACRSCGHQPLNEILSLGRTPLANALLDASQLDQPEETFPLELAFCPACSLVQITETVAPEKLFRDYVYFSSFSDTMVRHAKELAAQLVSQRQLGSQNLVMEIASNDGYLLKHYVERGVQVLGIEPARNIAAVAEQAGVSTLSEFFGVELADKLASQGLRADVLHSHNVLAHVADLPGVAEGAKRVLAEDGVWIIEAPYLRDLIENTEFDTIYHEHLCYFSLKALEHLFERHGLEVADVFHVPIHGGTIQLHVRHAGRGQPSDRVLQWRQAEAEWGVDRLETYRDFGRRVEALRASLLKLLDDLHAQGKRVAAYGASAKGSTLLNYFGVVPERLEFVVDRSTVKQGRYTPGTHLPILPPEALQEHKPDYVLLLTWNFRDEILAQQAEYRRDGGRFIVPIPQVEVV